MGRPARSDISDCLRRRPEPAGRAVALAIEVTGFADEEGVRFASTLLGSRRVSFTLDIRAPTDAHRKLAVADIVRRIEAIAKRRDLSLQIDVTHESHTVPCAPWLKTQVAEAVAAEGYGVFELPSGAGHDGMAMIDIADVAMLFVRCRGGISHNPAEHVEPADADTGARVLLRLIENFRPGEEGGAAWS
jgi:allantoate deiminase